MVIQPDVNKCCVVIQPDDIIFVIVLPDDIIYAIIQPESNTKKCLHIYQAKESRSWSIGIRITGNYLLGPWTVKSEISLPFMRKTTFFSKFCEPLFL
jgi:hypothetical protein